MHAQNKDLKKKKLPGYMVETTHTHTHTHTHTQIEREREREREHKTHWFN